MRLDFNTFQIAGPSTNTNSVTKVKAMAGVIVESADVSVTDSSQCLTDTFSVTNGGGGINPPTICGTNTGEHSKTAFYDLMSRLSNLQKLHAGIVSNVTVYIDVCHDQCSKLMFSLGSTAYFTNIPTRSWSIKVTIYCS